MIKDVVKDILFQKLLYGSLKKSSAQRGEGDLKKSLCEIVPDVSQQYTSFSVKKNDFYLLEKIRSLHAFQTSLIMKAVLELEKDHVLIADIGDSSGVHMEYAETLLQRKNISVEAFSVNLDPVAIDKITQKGRKAILCRAEELHKKNGIAADIFCAFEVLEHFFDPISFLKKMSSESVCQRFIITVPYVNQSRMGLQYIRNRIPGERIAENTHVFELSPADWDLIFKFSGWKVAYRDTFLQYPRRHPLSLTKSLWKKFDFEGFYGVILEKDDTYSAQYKDWA